MNARRRDDIRKPGIRKRFKSFRSSAFLINLLSASLRLRGKIAASLRANRHSRHLAVVEDVHVLLRRGVFRQCLVDGEVHATQAVSCGGRKIGETRQRMLPPFFRHQVDGQRVQWIEVNLKFSRRACLSPKITRMTLSDSGLCTAPKKCPTSCSSNSIRSGSPTNCDHSRSKM